MNFMAWNRKIFDNLKSQSNMMEGVNFPDLHPGHYCFRVTFDGTEFGLSISCPPGYDFFVETALLKSGRIIYDSEKDYDDIRRFTNIVELIAEINRVKAFYLPKG